MKIPRRIKGSEFVSPNDLVILIDASTCFSIPQLLPANTGMHNYKFICVAIGSEYGANIACTGTSDIFSNSENADFGDMVVGESVEIQSDGISKYWVVSHFKPAV